MAKRAFRRYKAIVKAMSRLAIIKARTSQFDKNMANPITNPVNWEMWARPEVLGKYKDRHPWVCDCPHCKALKRIDKKETRRQRHNSKLELRKELENSNETD